MASNDFLTFASAGGSNVINQATYAALATRSSGYAAGIALSNQLNKTWRQASIISSMIGQFIVDETGQNAVDDGTIATLEANFIAAIKNVSPTYIYFYAVSSVPTPPTIGLSLFFNTAQASSQTLTIDATTLTSNNVAVAFLGHNAQVITPDGTYINMPQSGLTGGPNFELLVNNGISAGIWNPAVTYGRFTSLNGYVPKEIGSVELTANLIIIANATSGNIVLTAYNPTTDTLGTPIVVSNGGTDNIVGAYAIDATHFVVMTTSHAVACSVAGLVITAGSAISIGPYVNAGGNAGTVDSCQLSVGVYLTVGAGSAFIDAQVISVVGTVCTAGALAHSAVDPTAAGSEFTISVDPASNILALCGWGTLLAPSVMAISITGTTPTFGVAVACPSGSLQFYGTCQVRFIPGSGSNWLCAYTSSAGYAIELAVASVAITTVTFPGAAVASGESYFSGTYALNYRHASAIPNGSIYKNVFLESYAGTTFILGVVGARAISIIGTAVTVGAATGSGPIIQDLTGTWRANGTAFTAVGSVITLGIAIPTNSGIVFSATLSDGHVNIGGTWFSYGTVNPNCFMPLAASGQALYYNGGSLFLQDLYS